MYAGEVVEEGPVRGVFGSPHHPYTRGLLDCLPTLGRDKRAAALRSIPGQVGSPLARPAGCAFASRCAHVEPGRCTTRPIPTLAIPNAPEHRAKCVRVAELTVWHHPPPATTAADTGRSVEATLSMRGLGKVYHQSSGIFGGTGRSIGALSNVELTAEHGRTLAIVGESGCGKSTLARILSGLQIATAGTADLDGAGIGHLAIDQRRAPLKRK